MPSDITINDKAAFQATIAKLTELNSGLEKKLGGSSAVAEAVAHEAGKGVVSVAGGSATAGGPIAASYTATVGALGSAVENINSQVTAASAAVQTAISDLQSLLTGLSTIDDDAAADVNKA